MAFGQDKPVPLRVLWLIRPDTKNAEIQRRQNVDGGHFPADMAGASFENRLQIAKTDLLSDTVEIVRLHETLSVNKYTVAFIFAWTSGKSSQNVTVPAKNKHLMMY